MLSSRALLRIAWFVALAPLVTGCRSGSLTPVPSINTAQAPGATASAIGRGALRVPETAGLASLPMRSERNLYVANFASSTVTVYAKSGNLLRTISQGRYSPVRLAFDSSGDLYVLGGYGVHARSGGGWWVGHVNVYAPGSKKVLRTIRGGLSALALHQSGQLFVGNDWSVNVYAPNSKRLLRTISEGVASPSALAFDTSGNLYVANYVLHNNTVTVYAPGSSTVLRTISHGVNSPCGLAFDGAGNLDVANHGDSTVTVYAPGSDTVLRTISQGVKSPCGLAHSGGNLYLANDGNSTVTVYAPGTKRVLRTISEGVASPSALAFDFAGNLYVANYGNGTVTVYARGTKRVLRTISQGVSGPTSLGFGP